MLTTRLQKYPPWELSSAFEAYVFFNSLNDDICLSLEKESDDVREPKVIPVQGWTGSKVIKLENTNWGKKCHIVRLLGCGMSTCDLGLFFLLIFATNQPYVLA